jgi:hypothetical protein
MLLLLLRLRLLLLLLLLLLPLSVVIEMTTMMKSTDFNDDVCTVVV